MKKVTILKRFFSLMLLICSVLIGGNFIAPNTTLAAVALEGGRALQTKFCSCSICFKIQVGSPKSGWFMYCPWYTRLYEHYNVFPNAWQLGKASSWIPCLQIAHHGCRTDGGGYLLDMTGTSQGS